MREAQRHVGQWALQPVAALIAQEASEKLATPVALDVMRPPKAFDGGGRASAMAGINEAMAMAKEICVDPDKAAQSVNLKMGYNADRGQRFSVFVFPPAFSRHQKWQGGAKKYQR